MHSLFVLCAIIFFYNIGRRVWKRFYHLSAFPGPRLAGYTRFWLLRTYASGNSQHTFLEVNRRFGEWDPVVSIIITHRSPCSVVTPNGMNCPTVL